MKLPRFIKLNLSTKMTLMSLAIICAFCLALVWLYHSERDQRFANRELKVQHETETAWGVINYYVGLEKAGRLSHEEAQQQAMAAVKGLRYGESGYFWINDTFPKMVMHPIKPKLDGQDLSAIKDPNGKFLFVEFAKVAKKSGGGFVDYYWPKPGHDKPVAKISYVKLVPGWDWVVGSGLYVDDVEAEMGSILRTNLFLLVAVLVVTAVLVFLVSRSVTRPLATIRKAVHKLSQGETDIEVDCGRPVDCSSLKGCNEPNCPSFGKADICWVTAGSFAIDMHCPRALKGEDCRTCELYGPRNYLQELGSGVMGLANAMRMRAELAREIADGDLTKKVKVSSSKDELGQALVQMHGNLNSTLCQIHNAASLMDNGASAVEGTSQALTDGSTRQAAALEQINSSVAQMASQTKQNADNAEQANQLSTVARGAAENGNRKMAELVNAMAAINESGQNIGKIIKVIDEIAFQTNLLALNAAVEAARAGQHGKGFAVVAEEVRNLAARSAKAARETAELIEGSVQKAGAGAELADTTAAALAEIVNGISKASDLVGEIAAASSVQARGIEQINEGLNQIDEVSQQNTANAEETSATAVELATQVRQLNQLLGCFQLDRSKCAEAKVGNTFQRSISQPPPRPAAAWSDVGTSGGWGSEAQIALDDGEFGRY